MFAPISPCPGSFASKESPRLWLFGQKLKVQEAAAREDCEPARVGLELSQGRQSLALALGHDGLRVFANRVLADWIFTDRVLADWRRRHRGRLPARQIGGSGNAHHGEEPSRRDYDDLHDANPLVFGHPDGPTG
jgi:hypothetical protein